MVDCSKSIEKLTPSEASQCFREARIWTDIENSFVQTKGLMGKTTIEEWVEIIVAFGNLPAQLISYLWIFVVGYRIISKEIYVSDLNAMKATGYYLLIFPRFKYEVQRGLTTD